MTPLCASLKMSDNVGNVPQVENVDQQPNAIPKSIFEQHVLQPSQNHENRGEKTQTPVVENPARLESNEVVLQNLENSFAAFAFRDVDVNANCEFHDYLVPNEGGAINIRTHLDKIEEPGILVSVGTERSFFDLCLCDPEKCQGLVVRDINPRVKAYVDFNILLLRISTDREHYCSLSQTPKEKEERIAEIRELLEQSNIENPARLYYLTHLDGFARIYFRDRKFWREYIQYQGVQYHKDDQLFYRLQKYAKEGKIIATVGSINDLQFLQNVNIAFVDVSNVPDYSLIDLQLNEQSDPLIVWTRQDCQKTEFRACRQKFLTGQSRKEMDQLLESLVEAKVIINKNSLGIEIKNLVCFFSKETYLSASFSEETLSRLKKYRDRHMIHTSETGWICFNDFQIEKLNTMNPVQLEALCHHPRIADFVSKLVENWVILDHKTYFAFSSVPGWKEAFQSYAKKHEQNECFMEFLSGTPQSQAAASFSEETLSRLEEYRDHHAIHTPETGWVSFNSRAIKKLNKMNPVQLEALCRHPRTAHFVDILVQNWMVLDRKAYLAFSSVPGWKEAFQSYVNEQDDYFKEYIYAKLLKS